MPKPKHLPSAAVISSEILEDLSTILEKESRAKTFFAKIVLSARHYTGEDVKNIDLEDLEEGAVGGQLEHTFEENIQISISSLLGSS